MTAVVVWAELGDCRRFSRSTQVVRHTGLDVTVDSSDRHRGRGHLSRQGPETLRWALFEAGMAASHATSPDREYFRAVKQAHDGKLAAISVARKLARRCYHTLREMDRRWSTPCPLEPQHAPRRRRWPGPPTSNIRVSAVSSCPCRARQHSCWTAL